MKKTFKRGIALLAFVAIAATSVDAQIKTPQPSPAATVTQAFGLGEVSIEYSRPAVKGRVVYGDLVPFDKLWRTGANASTKINFTDDVIIAGSKVSAGEYALYTIPGKAEWTVMINKNTKLWGAGNPGDYKESEDVARIKVKPQTLASNVESFTIDVSDITNNSCMINISWEKTKVSFKVETEIDAKITASIEKTLNPKPGMRDYFSAAAYYYEADKDMSKALEYVNAAIEMNKEAFWMVHMKAKILKKMNNLDAAIEAANASKALAEKASNADYIALNDKLIAECKAPAKKK